MKNLILIFLYSLSLHSSNCEVNYESLKRGSCNLIALEVDKKSPYLKIEGIDLETKRVTCFNPDSRSWHPLTDYISIGDTVVKLYGVPITTVFKKDSIVSFNYENLCDKDFNFENIELRNYE